MKEVHTQSIVTGRHKRVKENIMLNENEVEETPKRVALSRYEA